MLYNNYRPHKFSEVVGQKQAVKSLMKQSQENKFFNTYIFCGQFGSGKTSMARILAMAANCTNKEPDGSPCCSCPSCKAILDGNSLDVQEIAAAVDTGVGKVREICENAQYLPTGLNKKVYIIDEVQALSKAAFQAFLKVLEEPPAHVLFILATTDVGSIPPTVRSRAATFYFNQLSQEEISGHLMNVSAKEGFRVTEDACNVIAKYAQGSMRNALSLLEMATCDNGSATGESVERQIGVSAPDAVFSVLQSVLSGNAGEIVERVTSLVEGGTDLNVLVSDMLTYATDLTVASVSPKSVKGSEHDIHLINETVKSGSPMIFTSLCDGLMDAKALLKKQAEAATLIVSLIRVSRREDIVSYVSSKDDEILALKDRIQTLEQMVLALSKGKEILRPAFGEELETTVKSAPIILTSEEEPALESGDIPLDVAVEQIRQEERENSSEVVYDAPAPEKFYEDSTEDISYEKLYGETYKETEDIPSAEKKLVENSVKANSTSTVSKEVKGSPAPIQKKENSDSGIGLLSFLFNNTSTSVAVTETVETAFVVAEKVEEFQQSNKEEKPCKKLDELISTSPSFAAALACCKVREYGDTAEIIADLPAVKQFIKAWFIAFGNMELDTAGITVL